MKTFIKSNSFIKLLGFILIFIIWFLISEIINEKSLIFPGPISSIKEFFFLMSKKSTYISILYSLYKMLIGYIVSILLALIIGTIAGLYKKIYILLSPLMTTLKAIPTASLLFLFIVLAGFDNSPIYVVILVSFPILYESIVGGIVNIPRNISDAISLDGGINIKNTLKVKLPLATNYILVGIASSFSLAFKVEIMSEVLSGSTSYGIGSSIKLSQITSTNMTPIFAWTIIAVLLMLIFDYLAKIIKNKLIKQ